MPARRETPVRRWLISGVSSGLGRALAEAALARGDHVAGTLRQRGQAEAFEVLAPGRAHGIVLDVTHRSAIEDAVLQAVDRLDHVDVLVNNAGYGFFAAVEETAEDEARQVMDTNFFGAWALTQALLPHMRGRGRGHIVNISSIAGVVGLPGCGMYNASKFALEGLSEALSLELAPLGLHVTLIEPGGFRTRFGSGSMRVGRHELSAYAETAGRTRYGMAQFDRHAQGDPAKGAQAILAAVDAPEPPLRLALGVDALKAVRGKAQALARQMDAWETVSTSTGVGA